MNFYHKDYMLTDSQVITDIKDKRLLIFNEIFTGMKVNYVCGESGITCTINTCPISDKHILQFCLASMV